MARMTEKGCPRFFTGLLRFPVLPKGQPPQAKAGRFLRPGKPLQSESDMHSSTSHRFTNSSDAPPTHVEWSCKLEVSQLAQAAQTFVHHLGLLSREREHQRRRIELGASTLVQGGITQIERNGLVARWACERGAAWRGELCATVCTMTEERDNGATALDRLLGAIALRDLLRGSEAGSPESCLNTEGGRTAGIATHLYDTFIQGKSAKESFDAVVAALSESGEPPEIVGVWRNILRVASSALPSSFETIANLRKRVLNPNSSPGDRLLAAVTLRLILEKVSEGLHNRLSGLDKALIQHFEEALLSPGR